MSLSSHCGVIGDDTIALLEGTCAALVRGGVEGDEAIALLEATGAALVRGGVEGVSSKGFSNPVGSGHEYV
jgi:hypothetical protein